MDVRYSDLFLLITDLSALAGGRQGCKLGVVGNFILVLCPSGQGPL